MDIPNLSTNEPSQASLPKPKVKSGFNIYIALIIFVVAVSSGFWLSRLFPSSPSTNSTASSSTSNKSDSTPVSPISEGEKPQVGKLYGNGSADYKDSATGTLTKGSINGEGTHILDRDGNPTHRASLTSSNVDLDLFVDKKVEVKGQTNTSKKTGWLLDVGSIKILE